MKYEGYYLAFFVFIGLIVIIFYYNMQQSQELIVKKVDNINNISTSKTNNININNNNNDHNKIYDELGKYKKINNYTYNIDNVDFHKDNINGDESKLGNPNLSIFDSELEEVYNTNLRGNNNNNNNDVIFDFSIKPNKTDLPIANPPLQLLKTDAPLRLSERHLL
jgi:hypothetical protein